MYATFYMPFVDFFIFCYILRYFVAFCFSLANFNQQSLPVRPILFTECLKPGRPTDTANLMGKWENGQPCRQVSGYQMADGC